MSSAPVIVVGSYNQDHVWSTERLPFAGETRLGRFASGPGGKGFNQAVAAARMGVETCLIAALGDDELAQRARQQFDAEGLQTRIQDVIGESSGSAGIIVDEQGANQIVVAPGANTRLSVDFIDQQQDAIDAARVMITQLECDTNTVRHALQRARASDTLCILNPAPVADDIDHEFLRLADIITPNETEFAAIVEKIYGQSLPEGYWRAEDELLHKLCRAMAIPIVIITLGDQGCFVSHANAAASRDADECYRIPAFAANTVDTTGAGDCFNGALAAALVRQEPSFRHAVCFAARAAALSTERPGAAMAMPRLAEMLPQSALKPD